MRDIQPVGGIDVRELVEDELANPDSGQTPGTLGANQASRIRTSSIEKYYAGFWTGRIAREAPLDCAENHQRYRSKPLGITVPFATMGVFLFILQLLVPQPIPVNYVPLAYVGYLRAAMILIAGYCIFMAWPSFVNMEEAPAEREERDELHAQFDATRKDWDR